MKKDVKLNLMFLMVPLILMLVVVVGITYALFTQDIDTEKTITVTTGDKYVGIYGDDKDNIELNNIYTFNIVNKGNSETGYEIYMESTTAIFSISGDEFNEGTLNANKILVGNLDVGEEITINLQLTSDVVGKFVGVIKARTSDYKVNSPELVDGMLAVNFNGTNWVKADANNLNNEWYDYIEGSWANVVTIKDETKRKEYTDAEVGTVINNDDINAFFVWIPRYSYTLHENYGVQMDGAATPSKETPGAVDIKFIGKNVVDNGKAIYKDVTPDEYYTPVAFCFGDTCRTSRNDRNNIELSGIWVSKFELTGEDNNLTILPNVESIRELDVSSFYTLIKNNLNGEVGNTNYGFDSDYDGHMIKNSEWSVVSLLSQSKYGKYGNLKYDGVNKEIYQNKSDLYTTGCSYGSPSNANTDYGCENGYGKEPAGVGSSSTGTIYGVYDLSGGAAEYVMSSLTSSILSSNDKSAFTNDTLPALKYYDGYDSVDVATACNNGKCLGENLLYTKNWYGDKLNFVTNETPWLVRGGTYKFGVDAGVFSVDSFDGSASKDISTRAVIVKW